jgi:hypothetical protein
MLKSTYGTDRCSPSVGSQVVWMREGWAWLEDGGSASGRRVLTRKEETVAARATPGSLRKPSKMITLA